MKTFIIALSLLLVVVAFALINMIYISGCVGEMLDIAENLPKNKDEFEANYQAPLDSAEHLWAIWDSNIERLAYTVSYETIDRADDAMSDLYRAAQNRDGEEFTAAVLKFADSIRRLRELENFNANSIF